jgi:23S rRNA-/tRNA-specific pseudouridylate synthase
MKVLFRVDKIFLLFSAARAFSSPNAVMNALVPARFGSWDGSLANVGELRLFEDKDIIVMYKPPSILSQADIDGGKGNLFDATLNHVTSTSTLSNLYLIHRLDRPCSGVMVFAKSSVAATRLSANFRGRIASKCYLCVVNGELVGSGELHNHLQKSNAERIKCYDFISNKEVDGDGKASESKIPKNVVEAKLKYESLLHISGGTELKPIKQTLVRIDLETGRKHQIRAQMAHIGHPIVGDVKYGAPQQFKQRDLALHAYSLSFPHPITKKKVSE